MAVPIPDGRSWIIPCILVVLGWGASTFWGYHVNDVDVMSRVTAVETQQRIDSVNQKERLNRIEDKIDRLFVELTGRRP